MPVGTATGISTRYTGKFTGQSCVDTWTGVDASYTGIDTAAIAEFNNLRAYTDSISPALTPLKTALGSYST